MAWKDISFARKLVLGFGIVFVLLIITGILGYNGVGSITQNAKTVIQGHQLDGMLAQKEIDHLNWISRVNQLWTDAQTQKIDVQTDDHQCGFGQWLYGQGRKELEMVYPDMADLIKSIEGPHHQLHISVIEINQLMVTASDKNLGLVSAGVILNKKTLPALKQVQDLLHKIRKSTSDRVMSDEAMIMQALNTRRFIIIGTIIAILAGVMLASLIAVSISRPTAQAVTYVEHLAKGDFTISLPVDRKDEIGRLAIALNSLAANLGKMIRGFNNGIITLNASSTELGTVSEHLSIGADLTSNKAHTVTMAAEQMSTNMNTVAAASEEASTNVNLVAAATEEMSATVQEIAQNSEASRQITGDAVCQAQAATIRMDELGDAAKAISNVVEVISEISEQTNLLALNATIEAARAGEAGKGFAVVASEIKALADQTAQATLEIKQKINNIQSATIDTVSQIQRVTEIIKQVNEIGTTIATAVEEQSIATREVANNVTQAAQGIQEVNINVAGNSEVAANISDEISEVNLSADKMAISSSQVNISAQDLKKLADRLNQMIIQYKITEASFDIGEVKSAHLQWRSRLEGLLHGRQALKSEEVSNHHECAFGKWYDGPGGQVLKTIPVFSVVGQHHEKVHTLARQIVDFHHRGENEKASALMISFEKEREKLFLALDDLYLS